MQGRAVWSTVAWLVCASLALPVGQPSQHEFGSWISSIRLTTEPSRMTRLLTGVEVGPVQIAPDDQIVPRNRFDPGATSQVDLLAVMLAFFRSFPVGTIVD